MTEHVQTVASDRETHDPRQEAGQDKSIAERLERHPESPDAKLDNALDELMDASDPPSTQPKDGGKPAASSGFDADEERRIQQEKSR